MEVDNAYQLAQFSKPTLIELDEDIMFSVPTESLFRLPLGDAVGLRKILVRDMLGISFPHAKT